MASELRDKAPFLKGGLGVCKKQVAASADSLSHSHSQQNNHYGKAYALFCKKKATPNWGGLKRRLPTFPRENRSIIGVSELNFSVRNGKRWNLTAITT